MTLALKSNIYSKNNSVEVGTRDYILQIFKKRKQDITDKNKKIIIYPEVQEAIRYKDLSQLYSEYILSKGGNDGADHSDKLTEELIERLIAAQDIKVENAVLNVIIGHYLPKMEFINNLKHLIIITSPESHKKNKILIDSIPQMSDCIYQLSIWLNMTNVKKQQQASACLEQWEKIMAQLDSQFIVEKQEHGYLGLHPKHIQKDAKFTDMFIKAKAYSYILRFFKNTKRAKLEAAANVMKGSDCMGLFVASFSRALLSTIQESSKALSIFCRDSYPAKRYTKTFIIFPSRLLKHIKRITLIPAPGDKEKDETRKLFSEIIAPDVELFYQITLDNKDIASLNNHQIRYFKELMSALNKSITKYNIHKIFKVFHVNYKQSYLIEYFGANNKRRAL